MASLRHSAHQNDNKHYVQGKRRKAQRRNEIDGTLICCRPPPDAVSRVTKEVTLIHPNIDALAASVIVAETSGSNQSTDPESNLTIKPIEPEAIDRDALPLDDDMEGFYEELAISAAARIADLKQSALFAAATDDDRVNAIRHYVRRWFEMTPEAFGDSEYLFMQGVIESYCCRPKA